MSRRSIHILYLLFLFCQPALAAIELTTADGRRILLNDDHTWEYLSPDNPQQTAAATQPYAVLRISHVNEVGEGACRIGVRLQNDLPYKIKNLAIRFAAYKSESQQYSSETRSFFEIKPTDHQYQNVYFRHISCSDIHHVKVEDPGRCSMGDLDRFSAQPGDCIKLIKVEHSELIDIRK